MEEDKQLNFYQPLLSVRRSLPTVTSVNDVKRRSDNFQSKVRVLPFYKSELKSGPLTKAGTVPFVWEQAPGRPKDESRQRNLSVEPPPVAPKLPPGRILKTRNEESDKISEHPSLSKRHGEQVHYYPQSVTVSNQNETKLEVSIDARDEETSNSVEGDETYLDALDTLSGVESVSLNCSVSGISGLDGSGLDTSRAFSADPQTRDFMMGRFLPAAKAMTSETPQYTPRKQQPVVWEQPRQIMNVVSGEKRPSLRYENNIGPHNVHEKDLEETDDEHEFPAKVCGLLPLFCLKSSLCRINPIPGMSVRTRLPMSPGSRTHGSSSSAGSSCENENEHIRTAVNEQRSLDELQATELHDDMSGSNSKLDELSCPFNPHKLEGSNLYKRLQGNGTPTYQIDLPRHAFSDQNGFRSSPEEPSSTGGTGLSPLRKSSTTFKELLAVNGEVGSGNPMIEKSVYVDIVRKVEYLGINSYDPYRKGGRGVINHPKLKPVEETPTVESSLKDAGNMNVEDSSRNHDDFNQVPEVSSLKGFGQTEGLDYYDLTTSVKSEVPHNVNMVLETQQPAEAKDLEISNENCSKFPAPPPLPKSPSDSWLWRTLPSSMPSRGSSLRSGFGTKSRPGNYTFKTSDPPKWGTTVKTTMGQRQNVRSSEELLLPILES